MLVSRSEISIYLFQEFQVVWAAHARAQGYKKIEAKATKLFVKYCTHMFRNAFLRAKFSPPRCLIDWYYSFFIQYLSYGSIMIQQRYELLSWSYKKTCYCTNMNSFMVFVNSLVCALQINSSSNVIENKLPTILHTHPSYICISIRICHYFPDSSKVPFAHAKTLYEGMNHVRNKLREQLLLLPSSTRYCFFVHIYNLNEILVV